MSRLFLQELKLTAGEMLRWEAMSDRLKRYDKAPRERFLELEKRIEPSDEQRVVSKTGPKKKESRKTKNHRNGSVSSGGTSSREMNRSREKIG